MHSPGSEAQRWDVIVWGCKRFWEDKIYKYTHECLWVCQNMAVKMTQKLGKKGIFEHDNDPEHPYKNIQEFPKKKK